MALRNNSSIESSIVNFDYCTNKAEIRKHILEQWSNESPNTRYRYFVETLANGDRIYLERPASLNKGCDFVIYIENHTLQINGFDKAPKFNLILNDLILKKENLTNSEWDNLISAVREIYNCNSFSTANQFIQENLQIGESYELILKLLKWFLIEQDITYWSGSGREMLFNRILEI